MQGLFVLIKPEKEHLIKNTICNRENILELWKNETSDNIINDVELRLDITKDRIPLIMKLQKIKVLSKEQAELCVQSNNISYIIFYV